MDATLYRAAQDVHVEGRELLGRAIPWETPARVRDIVPRVGPWYLEDFARSSADVSLRQNPEPRPLFNNHGHVYGDMPIGVVHYTRGEQGLMFRAFVSKTRAGDEALELVRDGAATDVSPGFRPIKSTQVRSASGEPVTRRTEIALRELSLAPTGYGQFPGAKVLAMRSAMDADDDPAQLMAAVDAAIDAALKCVTPDDDDYNPAQAHDILVAAETTVDALLAMFNIPDPDDEVVRSVVAPPLRDQLLRMRARRPLLRSLIDPPK